MFYIFKFFLFLFLSLVLTFFIFAGVSISLALWFSSTMLVLILFLPVFSNLFLSRVYKFNKISCTDNTSLCKSVSRLAKLMNLTKVSIYELDLEEANLLVLPSKRHLKIFLTKPMFNLLSKEELEAVTLYGLAYTKMPFPFISSSVELISYILLLPYYLLKKCLSNDSPILPFLSVIFFPIATFPVRFVFDDSVIFNTDKLVKSLGLSRQLATALKKIAINNKNIGSRLRMETINLALYNPYRDDALFALFNIHPTVNDRINRLLA